MAGISPISFVFKDGVSKIPTRKQNVSGVTGNSTFSAGGADVTLRAPGGEFSKQASMDAAAINSITSNLQGVIGNLRKADYKEDYVEGMLSQRRHARIDSLNERLKKGNVSKVEKENILNEIESVKAEGNYAGVKGIKEETGFLGSIFDHGKLDGAVALSTDSKVTRINSYINANMDKFSNMNMPMFSQAYHQIVDEAIGDSGELVKKATRVSTIKNFPKVLARQSEAHYRWKEDKFNKEALNNSIARADAVHSTIANSVKLISSGEVTPDELDNMVAEQSLSIFTRLNGESDKEYSDRIGNTIIYSLGRGRLGLYSVAKNNDLLSKLPSNVRVRIGGALRGAKSVARNKFSARNPKLLATTALKVKFAKSSEEKIEALKNLNQIYKLSSGSVGLSGNDIVDFEKAYKTGVLTARSTFMSKKEKIIEAKTQLEYDTKALKISNMFKSGKIDQEKYVDRMLGLSIDYNTRSIKQGISIDLHGFNNPINLQGNINDHRKKLQRNIEKKKKAIHERREEIKRTKSKALEAQQEVERKKEETEVATTNLVGGMGMPNVSELSDIQEINAWDSAVKQIGVVDTMNRASNSTLGFDYTNDRLKNKIGNTLHSTTFTEDTVRYIDTYMELGSNNGGDNTRYDYYGSYGSETVRRFLREHNKAVQSNEAYAKLAQENPEVSFIPIPEDSQIWEEVVNRRFDLNSDDLTGLPSFSNEQEDIKVAQSVVEDLNEDIDNGITSSIVGLVYDGLVNDADPYKGRSKDMLVKIYAHNRKIGKEYGRDGDRLKSYALDNTYKQLDMLNGLVVYNGKNPSLEKILYSKGLGLDTKRATKAFQEIINSRYFNGGDLVGDASHKGELSIQTVVDEDKGVYFLVETPTKNNETGESVPVIKSIIIPGENFIESYKNLKG